MNQDHPTFHGFEVGDVTRFRCDICHSALAYLYDPDRGYLLTCVTDPANDHTRMLTPQDIEG